MLQEQQTSLEALLNPKHCQDVLKPYLNGPKPTVVGSL